MNTNVVSTAVKRRGILESSRLRSARRARTRDQLLDPRQDTRHNRVDTGGVWVHSIALVQLGIGGHPVKEEWIKDDRMSRGKRRINGVEGAHKIRPHVGGCPHAREQDGDAAAIEFGEDAVERGLGQLRVEPTQSVVGAELDDHRLGSFRNRPVQTAEPTGRGIARHPGIGDADGDAFGLQRPRQLGGKSGIRQQTPTGAQRVAEDNDLNGPIIGRLGATRRRWCLPNTRFRYCAITSKHSSLPAHRAIAELADVFAAVSPCEGALPVLFAIAELTDVFAAVSPRESALPVWSVIAKFPDVFAAVSRREGALAISPRTLVSDGHCGKLL